MIQLNRKQQAIQAKAMNNNNSSHFQGEVPKAEGLKLLNHRFNSKI